MSSRSLFARENAPPRRTRLETRTILIDGYNVIRNVPALAVAEARALAAGRDALLARVEDRYRGTPHRVLVVFDGDGPARRVLPLRCGKGSQCVFSAGGELADAVIVDLAVAERARNAVVVVATNDLAVRLAAQAAGAEGASVAQVAARLNAAPRDLQKRAAYRSHVRAEWDRDAEPRPSGPRKANGHRAPRRKRGRPESGLL
ncbi:MAG TPA: NYN domain-containing protein [Ktedonobacterales bacterium]|jgi:hypothetical protein